MLMVVLTIYSCDNDKPESLLKRHEWHLQEIQIPQGNNTSEYNTQYYTLDFSNNILNVFNDASCQVWQYEWEINDSVLCLVDKNMGAYETWVIESLTEKNLVVGNPNGLIGPVRYVRFIYGVDICPNPVVTTYEPPYVDLNPLVVRLSSDELSSNNTPAAVAFNFVQAILQSDYQKMQSYMEQQAASDLVGDQHEPQQAVDEFFSQPGKYNIMGWKNMMSSRDYEVAVLYVQDEGFWDKGKPLKKVYIDCIPSSQIGNTGFQDVYRTGETNIKVLVVNLDSGWKVVGFK